MLACLPCRRLLRRMVDEPNSWARTMSAMSSDFETVCVQTCSVQGTLIEPLFFNGIKFHLSLGALWPRLHGYYNQGVTPVTNVCRLSRVETKR